MAQGQSRNPNHPRKGAAIKVEPIRDLEAIDRIKFQLCDKPRDLCLFVLGINTAFRASELLSITVGQVEDAKWGDILEIKQPKTGKYRMVPLNKRCVAVIRNWLEHFPAARRWQPDSPLFLSGRGREPLTVSTVNHLVKKWTNEAGLKGNFGSHTLRKTWGYHQRTVLGTAVPILMEAYGHQSQKETLDYLGIQPDEVMDIYLKLEL